MRAVVQRVLSAKVVVDGHVVSEIGPGLCVLAGISDSDAETDSEFICRKVLNMRLWPNESSGKAWDQSVMQRGYDILMVSQFTLYGLMKGNKPDFHLAMPPQQAKLCYQALLDRVGQAYRPDKVKDGIFGTMMQVHIVNDGPVTMQLDSRRPSDLNGSNQPPS